MMGTKKGRILGIDYGKVRVGIAISDERAVLSTPLFYLNYKQNFLEKLKELLEQYEVQLIVIGLPLSMRGVETESSAEVRAFALQIEKISSIPIKLWDERLTTVQVERSLKELGVNRKRREKVKDSMAASLILQSYLDSQTEVE